mmetsp:Transcript_14442/g.36185  ORF Transcript_14442/g.36185 Transcript_14442/m.36185 type:complete len:214 (+) Transcript_14442:736-1377(+)
MEQALACIWNPGMRAIPAAHSWIDGILNVRSVQAADGNPEDILLEVVASLLQEWPELAVNLVETLQTPSLVRVADGGIVHLVHHNHKLGDTECLGKLRVLACLAASVKSRLELTLPRCNHENANIRLRRAGNHIRHVVLVPRCVQNRVALHGRLEVRPANLHGLALGALLLVCVHDVRHVPAFTVLFLRLSLVLFNRALVHASCLKQDLAADG